MAKQPRYSNIEVTLIGTDGNAFALLSKVRKALERHGVNKKEIEEFTKEATSGDYDHLLDTIDSWVVID